MSDTTSPSKGKVAIPGLLEMLKAGVHFGHMTSKWHPKMQRFIFTSRSGVHIINLEATKQKLEEATNVIADTVAKGGNVLFVGTKKQVQEDVKRVAASVNMPYIHERWIGGLLTNFGIISRMIKRHRELGQIIETSNYGDRTKKERLELTREHKRLNDVIGGISALDRIPDLIFLIDVRRERTAVREAAKVGVPIVGLCDTNTNPESVRYPIPANDDAVGSVQMMLSIIAEAVKVGQTRQATEMVKAAPVETVDKKATVIKAKVEAVQA